MPLQRSDTPQLCRRLWRDYMRPHRGRMLLALLFMALAAAATAGPVKLMEVILDRVFIDSSQTLLWGLTAAVFGLLSLRGVCNFIQITLLNGVGMQVVHDVQQQMFAALQRGDLDPGGAESTGGQLSRFTHDVALLRETAVKVFTGAGRDLLTVALLTAVMLQANWRMALAAALFFPLSLFPVRRIGRHLRKISQQTQGEVARMTEVLDDSLKGLRQTRAYNREAYEIQRAGQVFAETQRLALKAVRTRSLMHPVLDLLSGLTTALVIGWGGLMILDGALTVGQFMAFFIAVFAAYQPVRSLASLHGSLQEGLAAAHRVFTLLDRTPRVVDTPDAQPLRPGPGRVVLDRVTFTYPSETTPVLQALTLTVEPGETVALVGPSGAGKSTLLNLILRFYDPQSGRVLVDDQDIRTATMRSLRDRIALVSQDAGLFNDSIRANIAYGRPDASAAEIEAAARAAAADDFIAALPQGYDTSAGEQGARLSGGQRQRILIARAILKAAPILLLDEATSALDAESERAVQTALERLTAGRTTIMVAHRLSTARRAARICVLDNGAIVEEGAHDALLAQDGLYAKLCRIQFQGTAQNPTLTPTPTPIPDRQARAAPGMW